MKRLFLYIITLCTLFVPGIGGGSGANSPGVHVEVVMVCFVAISLFFLRSPGQLFFGPYLRIITLPYIAILMYMLILTWGVSGSNMPMYIAVNMIGALGRFRGFIYAIVLFALLTDRKTIAGMVNMVVLCIVLEFALLYMQAQDLFGVNSWLSPLYRSSGTEGMGTRVFGSTGNPNVTGTILSAFGTLAFSRVVFDSRKIPRIIAAISVLLALVGCVWLAQTRQGTLCLLAGCLVVLMIAMRWPQRRAMSLFVIIAMFLLFLFGLSLLSKDQELANRFAVFSGERSLTEEGSVAARFEHLEQVQGMNPVWLLLGQGITITEGLDSELLNTLSVVGVPGVFLLLVIMLRPGLHLFSRARRMESDDPDLWIIVGGAALCVPVVLASLLNSIWSSPQVMSLLMTVYLLPLALLTIRDSEDDAAWELEAQYPVSYQ